MPSLNLYDYKHGDRVLFETRAGATLEGEVVTRNAVTGTLAVRVGGVDENFVYYPTLDDVREHRPAAR